MMGSVEQSDTMPNIQSHVQKARRTFSGEDLCEGLIEYLNWGSHDPKEQREQQGIVRLLEAISRLKELTERPASRAEIRAQQETLARLCRHYSRFYPLLWVDEKPPYKHRVWWRTSTDPLPGRPASLIHFYDHNSAINHIARIIAAEHLDKLRRCNCGAWFFARFSHMRFCSTECQQRTYKDSPEWREYRREKSKQYYKLHKEGKVRERNRKKGRK